MIEIDFKEPTLEPVFLINEVRNGRNTEVIEKYILENHNLTIYEQLVKSGIMKNNEKVSKQIKKEAESELKRITAVAKEELDQEVLLKSQAEFYAKIMNVEEFEKKTRELLEFDQSSSLKMDILFCKIRMAVILNDQNMLAKNIEKAQDLSVLADWDRKNRFKVYLGLFNMMKGEFKEAANNFYECLVSFEAEELFDFSHVILYLVFSGLLGFKRSELETKIVSNSEVLKHREFLQLAEAFYFCNYGTFFASLLAFIDLFKNDVFISVFSQTFCREMKIKGYKQFLLSYQSVHMDKMADVFGVSQLHLEEDIRTFVVANKIKCSIDKIDNIIIVEGVQCNKNIDKEIAKGSLVLREIRKKVN
ncbi:hypothetical protein NUSPORA_00047 [Nucleospora cyclopteri]